MTVQDVRSQIAFELNVTFEGEWYRIDVPITYDDGDGISVYARPESDKWIVADRGATLFRSGFNNIDVLDAKHIHQFNSILNLHGFKLVDGEIIATGVENLCEAMFALTQVTLEVVRLGRA